MRLAKRLAFFRFDFCFGIIKGEQPLIRGSSASKSLALFWFSFVRQKRTNSAPLQHIEIAAPLPSGASLTERHSSSALRIASFTTAYANPRRCSAATTRSRRPAASLFL